MDPYYGKLNPATYMPDGVEPSGSANFSKLAINDIVGDYEKMIVEFQDGTTQELPRSEMVGVTEFKFDKPVTAIKFVRPEKETKSSEWSVV
jgi:hypothetical protein